MRFKDKIRHDSQGAAKGSDLHGENVVVVTGLPRSGTSMMMKMLETGGLPVATDRIRQANASNPNGYYELEKVKKIHQDAGFLHHCRGKAVKIISELLWHLPDDHGYKLVFMLRDMPSILRSQKRMLLRRGQVQEDVGDDRMAQYFEEHLEKMNVHLNRCTHIRMVYMDYNLIVEDPPGTLKKLVSFLDCNLNLERMAGVVDPALCEKG